MLREQTRSAVANTHFRRSAILTLRVTTKAPATEHAAIQFLTSDGHGRSANKRQKPGEIRVVDRPAGKPPSVLLRASLGTKSRCTSECVRRAAGEVARWLADHGARQACLDVDQVIALGIPDALASISLGLLLGGFHFDVHKSKAKSPARISVHLKTRKRVEEVRAAVKRASAIAEGVNLARHWGHEPPNILNPVTLAQRVKELCKTQDLTCKIYDERELAKLNAGGLLSVGIASKTPPRLIVMEYKGGSSSPSARPVVLVGKAITFDTGGYSLKNTENIVSMKYDKCGGMAVIGAMQALAALEIKCHVVGIIAAAENMISGEAYRPDDIVKTMSGKTVEIVSTDAEGRMVLADALTFAQNNYKPSALIDLATLTGGVIVALGTVHAGLFSNDDQLAAALTASGTRVHERLWRLPLDEDYLELIRGDDGDLKNSSGRTAHPIMGGMFLSQFVNKKTRWAHLDIAGTATCEKDQPYCPKGATGFGVRLLVDYIEQMQEQAS